jgi:hypothetical protein
MTRTRSILLTLALVACGGIEVAPPDAASPDTQAADTEQAAPPDTRPGLLACGPGAITIEKDCEVLTAWKCQIPTELWRVPCVVPSLHRLLVASCDMCVMAEQLAGSPTP